MLKRIRFRTLVAVLIVAMILAITGLRGRLVGWQAEALLRDRVGATFTSLAESMARRFDADMRSRANLVSSLSRVDLVDDPATTQRVLEDMAARDPSIAWIGVTDQAGTVLAATDGILVGVSLQGRPVFREGRRGLFVGDVHDAVMLEKLLPNPGGEAMKFVDVAAPVHAANGDFRGVLAVHFSWSWVRDTARSLLETTKGHDGLEVFVVARDGLVLMGPDGSIGERLGGTWLAALRGGDPAANARDWADGGRYLTAHTSGEGITGKGGFGWTTIIRQPLDLAYRPAEVLWRQIILSGGGFALFFGIIAWLLSGRIARPLERITEAADRLGSGDTKATIPDTDGPREIARLSQSLQAMIATLTSQQTALARMEDIAYQDRLTALPNRRFFEQYLEAVMVGRSRLALLYMDLDGFKQVNDRLGHGAGDAVLREVGARLANCVRGNDVVARLGGDEFAAALPAATDGSVDPEALANRIIAAIREPITVMGEPVAIGCSVGIARWPENGATLADVIRRADEALYRAKREGRNRACWAENTDAGDDAGRVPADAV